MTAGTEFRNLGHDHVDATGTVALHKDYGCRELREGGQSEMETKLLTYVQCFHTFHESKCTTNTNHELSDHTHNHKDISEE